MSLLKKVTKNLLPVVIISTLVALAYLGYLRFIGIPKTQARELYNAAVEVKQRDVQTYKTLLQQAYISWPERYIGIELDSVK